jgi:hypothetical protein
MLSMIVTSNAFAGSRMASVSKVSPISSTRNVLMAVENVDKEPAWTFSPDQDSEKARARALLVEMGGFDVETGIGPWDPLELATVTGDAMDVETRLRWFRQAEIKHGRVCMAAFVGWIFSANGGAFPGMEQYIGATPLETWTNTPWEWELAFILSCGAIEFRTLVIAKNPNAKWNDWKSWMADAPDGASLTAPGMKLGVANVPFGWDPIRLGQGKKTDAERAESLKSELKNGRLAMVGFVSLYTAATIPDSVPFLSAKFDFARVLEAAAN